MHRQFIRFPSETQSCREDQRGWRPHSPEPLHLQPDGCEFAPHRLRRTCSSLRNLCLNPFICLDISRWKWEEMGWCVDMLLSHVTGVVDLETHAITQRRGRGHMEKYQSKIMWFKRLTLKHSYQLCRRRSIGSVPFVWTPLLKKAPFLIQSPALV